MFGRKRRRIIMHRGLICMSWRRYAYNFQCTLLNHSMRFVEPGSAHQACASTHALGVPQIFH